MPTAGELAAVLGAAYEAFLRTRLERRAGRRGNVHARAFEVFADMVKEMVMEAGAHGEAVWQAAVAELTVDRGEVEAEMLAEVAVLDVGHEWAAFLASVEQVMSANERHKDQLGRLAASALPTAVIFRGNRG